MELLFTKVTKRVLRKTRLVELITGVFAARNAFRRSIIVESTPVDHPNAAWDLGHRVPKSASSSVVPGNLPEVQILPSLDRKSPNFAPSRASREPSVPGFARSVPDL